MMAGAVEVEFQTAAEPLAVLAARNRVPSRLKAKSCQPLPAANVSGGPIVIPALSVRRSGQRSSPSGTETKSASPRGWNRTYFGSVEENLATKWPDCASQRQTPE